MFENSRILSVSHYTESGPRAAGMVLLVKFELNGREFMALNGGPEYKPTPAISFMVNCETQAEIDRLWEQLSEGGERGVCGWLVDKFGVSCQTAPRILDRLMADPVRADRVIKALLQMTRIDVAALQRAYEGEQ